MIDDIFDRDEFSPGDVDFLCSTLFVVGYGMPIAMTLVTDDSLYGMVQKVPIATSAAIIGCVFFDVVRKKYINDKVGIEDYFLSLATIAATSEAVDYIHEFSKFL